MKKNYVVVIAFLLVLSLVASGVWKKKTQSLSTSRPSPTAKVGYDYLPGSHLYPITSLSGQTYLESDDTYGFSMELPIEFKQRFEMEGFSSNQVSIEGYQDKIGTVDPKEEQLYGNTFTLGFDILDKSQLEKKSQNLTDFQKKQYPAIKNLKLGEKFIYEVLSAQEKKEILGENYTLPFNGDIIYTALKEVNGFKVFSYEDLNYTSASYGYVAVLENEKFVFSIFLFSFYPAESTPEIRSKVLDYYRDFYYTILQSFKYLR